MKILKRTWLEYLLISLFVAGVVGIGYLSVELSNRYQNYKTPKSLVFGTWVEQNVAPYVADSFLISSRGIQINGGVITTEFKFDGKHLEFTSGDVTRHFQLLNEEMTQMKLLTDHQYQPVYLLREKHKNDIR